MLLDRTHRILYSTDVVYLRSLYLLNPDSSVPEYIGTLERLGGLVPHLDVVYPSHGPSPISPALIIEILEGMREIQAGRIPDHVDSKPANEGGREDVTKRESVSTHEFGTYRVLIAEF